jgi:hypothetical protein
MDNGLSSQTVDIYLACVYTCVKNLLTSHTKKPPGCMGQKVAINVVIQAQLDLCKHKSWIKLKVAFFQKIQSG